jgi:branched-chain amino acid transport system permease protein
VSGATNSAIRGGRVSPGLAISLALALVAVVLPVVPGFSDREGVGLLTTVAITACLSLSWNLLGGFTGQLSIGHAVFFGCGAYASAALHVHAHWNPILGGLLGVVIAVVAALLIGYLAFRSALSDLNFALVTAALSLVALFFARSNGWLGGAFGLTMPVNDGPSDLYFTDPRIYYWLFLGLMLAILVLTVCLRRSRLGTYFVAVREDPTAADGLGIPVMRVKLIAIAISAALTAATGVLYASYLRFIDPDSALGFDRSLNMVIPAILGGTAIIAGPIVGSVIYGAVDKYSQDLLDFAGSSGLVLGVILTVLMLFLPRGIVPSLIATWRRWTHPARRSRPPGEREPARIEEMEENRVG